MLTLIKLLFYKLNLFNIWSFTQWIYIQHWYLIKFRKMRHFKLDFALTKKFFSWTFASFFVYRFFIYKILKLTKYNNISLNFFINYELTIIYWIVKWVNLLEQLIDISNVYYDQISKWQLLDYFFILEFPYIYDKIDRKTRWIRWIKHICKKYVLGLKFYSGKITDLKGSD